MFSSWGRLVYRHRRLVGVLTLALALGSGLFAAQASSGLSTGGWLVDGSESAAVEQRLKTEFGQSGSTLIVLYRTTDSSPATEPAAQARIEASLAGLADHDRVLGIFRWTPQTPDPSLVSHDGTATYAVVQLDASEEGSIDLVDDLRSRISAQPGISYALTGYAPLSQDSNEQSEADLARAELISLPLALLILVLVFASVVAAGMPLVVAGLAIPSTLGLVYLVSQSVEMSIYVLNVSTMLGLALAIDYSLFIVSRFREELARGRSTGEAVERAVATSGKAVVFSGLAVAIGLLGLLFFESPAISSIGIGGSLVVFCSVLYALTFLPAVLGMLGPRINALDLRAVVGRFRRRGGISDAPVRGADSWWGRVASWVMAHPVLVLVPTLGLLLIAGTPYLHLEQAVPDASVLPVGIESRDAYATIRRDFPAGETVPHVIIVDVPGDPADTQNAAEIAAYADRVAALPGVIRVEGPYPSTVSRANAVRLDAISDLAPISSEAGALADRIRTVDTGALTGASVGGVAATSHDTVVSMQSRTPLAIGTTLLVIAIVLFLLFGSVVLPIKAVLMTLLSITASFGALVWIFQDGNLAGFLNFEPLGYTVAGIPIIMFAVLIGLSMDYEVLLLSRIQEAYRRTGDNRASVAEGMTRTAGVITGAALIMVCVFAAFALADNVTIKAIGVGMAIAVAVDATIVRVLLVPATMRLMGRWNWWAPGPLGRLADRLGFSHVEAADLPGQPAPTAASSAASAPSVGSAGS